MRDHQRQSRDRGPRLLWAERLLVVAGAATLIWCAALVSDAIIAQQRARSSLEAALQTARPARPPAFEATTGDAPRVAPAEKGSPIATLSIPRVQLSAVVLHGSDVRTLRRGPGHLENTPFPGESGNVVIAGHRDSFFWPLRNIKTGDDIFLGTPAGQFHYRVVSQRVVNSHDISVIAATDQATLTLLTCYPFWVLGNAPDRFVVRAALVVDGAGAESESPPTPRRAVIDAAPVDAPAAAEPPATETPVESDEQLVRQAVERFRLIYNSPAIRRNDALAVPLTFRACEVTVIDTRAIAMCSAIVEPSSGIAPPGHTFLLERADTGWLIKSIAVG